MIHPVVKNKDKLVIPVYYLVAAVLFVYVCLRSVFVGLTHDEAITWSILNGETHLLTNSTNHWLNTIFAFATTSLFGEAEWALRLPNVLAFGLYLYFFGKILVRFAPNVWRTATAFFLAVANPFILEFFGLARGYGLSMAFLAGALHYLLILTDEFDARLYRRALGLIVLAVYANYAFIYCLGIMEVIWLISFFRKNPEPAEKKSVFRLTALQLFLLIPASINLIRLITRDQLYFGGDDNLFSDTFYSLSDRLFPFPLFKQEPLVFLILLGALMFFLIIQQRHQFKTKFVLWIMVSLSVITSVLHLASGMKFPIERTAMYWMLLLAVLFMIGNEKPSFLQKMTNAFQGLAIAAIMISFVSNLNVSYTWTWRIDAHSREVLEIIDTNRNGKEPVRLGIHWIYEPVMNYYRIRNQYEWLEPLTRDGFLPEEYDYYYVIRSESEQIPAKCTEPLATWDLSFSTLIKNCHR